MTAIKYKEGGTWKTLTMPSAVHIGASSPDQNVKQLWVDTDEGAPPSYYIPPLVTALPAAPFDGQEVRYQSAAMATDGIVWTFRYRAASLSAYKWEFVGGPVLTHEILTDEATTSSTYTNMGTVGPQVALPLAGDYVLAFGATILNGWGLCSPKYSASEAIDSDMASANTSASVAVARTLRRNGLSAGQVVLLRYRVSGTPSFRYRWLTVEPVRVS